MSDRTDRQSNYAKVRSPGRSGVTLMEVLFAIGIAVIGLYGVLILVPLAGRQVQDSYAITQTAAASQNVFREFQARGFHYPNPNRPWLLCEDTAINIGGVAAFDQPANFYNNFATPAFVPVRNQKELVQFQAGKLVAGGATPAAAMASAAQLSYCIDPLFWASQPLNGTDPITGGTEAGYRRSRFPYYMDNLNPLADPSNPTNNWDAQARMLRVTYPAAPLTASSPVYPSIFTGFVPAKVKVAQKMFASLDDVTNPISDSDGSVNGIRGYYISTSSDLLQQATKQEVTWMATLTPLDQDAGAVPSSYTLSIVAFHKRDRTFDAPTATFGGTPDPNDLPDAEKITWAMPPDLAAAPSLGSSGALATEAAYSGTNGFDLELYGNGSISSKVKPGEWLLLSRQFFFPPANTLRAVHKWYRIVSVSGEAEETGTTNLPMVTDPYGNTFPSASVPRVWRQTVHVLGPDWIFSKRLAPGVGAPFLQTPTIATIVPNVMNVYERVVDIPWE